MAVTKEQIIEQLRKVHDPELHRDIVTLNQVKNVAYCDGHASITVEIPQPSLEAKEQLRQAIEAAVADLDSSIEVAIDFPVSLQQQPKPQQQQQAQQQQSPQDQARASNPLPNVKHVIAVGAGKGGVGKSTISVNLAIGLARAGLKVGLLDGDIYGPSIPTMLGLDNHQPKAKGNTILPFELHGIKSMTIGSLVEDDKPLIWRGPMAHGAFRQLATQTEWGDLDYLIIDLPPGTGDVPLTLAQLLPLTGAVVVCTPQKVAQDDARRAVRMFEQLGIPLLGVVENMSYFIGDDGKEYDIFGKGGAEMMAQTLGVPFLGSVPINTRLRASADAGDPVPNFTAGDKLTEELEALVQQFVQQVNVAQLDQPTLTIS